MAKKRRRPIKSKATVSKPKKAAPSKRPKAAKPAALPAEVTAVTLKASSAVREDYGYVGKEIKHIVVITAGFVALQVALWLAFSSTGIEQQLTRFIHL